MRTFALIAAMAVTMAAGPAVAQTQRVLNGSFENGIVGWSLRGHCNATAVSSGNNFASSGTPSPAGPTEGGAYLQLFPQASNQTCYLYQDVLVPSGQTTLSFDASAGFNEFANTAEYSGSFRVMTTANVVLATPFVRDGSETPSSNLASYTADLTPYAGQIVRLAFEMTNDLNCCNVTYGDNVSVLTPSAPAPVPTLSEWAMILLGVAMAGGAALYLQRRKVAT